MPKKLKGGPFGLARYGMLRGKTGKTILVQFARPNGAIIFCRTFKNYFGQFVGIEKKSHYNSRVSLHEAPTKNAEGSPLLARRFVSTFGFFGYSLVEIARTFYMLHGNMQANFL